MFQYLLRMLIYLFKAHAAPTAVMKINYFFILHLNSTGPSGVRTCKCVVL